MRGRARVVALIQVLLGVALAVAGAPLANAADASFSLSVSPALPVFKVGSEVKLNIVLKNNTDHELRLTVVPFRDTGDVFSFKGTVSDADGKLVPLTELGARVWARDLFGADGSPVTQVVEPPSICGPDKKPYSRSKPPLWCGGSFCTDAEIEDSNRNCGLSKSSLVISRLHDLSKPGKYIVQLRRYDEESKQWVKSGPVTVTIIP